MKRATLLLLLALPAWADIPPAETADCRGKQAGAACTTPDGNAGTCVEMQFSRPDYSQGVPPRGTTTYTALGCKQTAPAASKSLLAWLGAALAFLAMVAAARGVRSPRPGAA